MPAQSNLMMNPMLANLSPADQQSLVQLQQRQAIGQALLQQGLQPIDTSNAQVGGLAYRVSPLQGAAKLLQTYLGNKMSMDSAGQQAQLMGQMYGNAFGTNQPSAPQAPAQQAAPTDAGGMTGDQSGPGVVSSPVATPGAAQLGQAMGGGAVPAQTAPPVQMGNGALTLPGKTPQQSMMLYSMLGPEGYARVLSQWGAPTDATRMAMQAGQDPRVANADALFKANYLAPNQGTPGTISRDPRTNQPMYYSPNVPANGQPVFDASGRLAGVGELPGANALISGQKAAETAGEGSQLPFTGGVDAQGRPLPVMSRTQATTGVAPPIPTVATPPGMSAPPGSGQPPPLPPGMSAGGSQGGGAIYAAPPMGAQANAEAQAKAQIETMQKSYQGIMPSRAGGAAAVQDIDNMVGLASGKPGIIAGKYATQAAGLVSANAAEYEKSRDNLVTNLGTQLGIGSDAAREMVYGAIPAYGAPHEAIVNGLATLKGQVQMRMQKADFMSGAYAKQDAVAYNQRDNAFDQNMTPALAGITSMPPGPARAAALTQAASDPQTRARLLWATQNGILK